MFIGDLDSDYDLILGLPHFVSFGIQTVFTGNDHHLSNVKGSKSNCGAGDLDGDTEQSFETCVLYRKVHYCSMGDASVYIGIMEEVMVGKQPEN